MKQSILKGLSAVFLWRKGHRSKEEDAKPDLRRAGDAPNSSRSEQPEMNRNDVEKDWLYVGNDEEGTPILLDKANIVHQSGSTPMRVWLKHVPSEGARSFEQARTYLKEAGRAQESLHHIEQLIELDLNRDLIADLVLSFLDRNDQLIEKVQFSEIVRRPLGTEVIYSAIKETVARLNAQIRHEPEPSAAEESGIDERIGLKLQEINNVLEAFDTCGETEKVSTAKPFKPQL